MRILCLVLFPLYLFSCVSGQNISTEGIVLNTTCFFNKQGDTVLSHFLKIWYSDSSAIEEIRGVNRITDTSNKTTTTYPIILYRYIDLRKRVLFDYKTFSDTAQYFNAAPLPDSLMLDYGWSFYSNKAPIIKDTPTPLSDTVIDGINYKRARFHFTWHDPSKNQLIGYFRCDRKWEMFSLEKSYSRSINCAMVKYFDYSAGYDFPYASKQVDFISSKFSPEEITVFKAWRSAALTYQPD